MKYAVKLIFGIIWLMAMWCITYLCSWPIREKHLFDGDLLGLITAQMFCFLGWVVLVLMLTGILGSIYNDIFE